MGEGLFVNERTLKNVQILRNGKQVDIRTLKLNGVEYKLEESFQHGMDCAELYIDDTKVFEGTYAYNKFAEYTGMDIIQFDTYLSKIQYRKMSPCCKKKAHWVDGFPGESLLLCPVCKKVHDTSFNIGAII